MKTTKPMEGLGCIGFQWFLGTLGLVEAAGIGHPRQPTRLHARWRSQARSMLLEFPAHPASVPDAASTPNSRFKTKRPLLRVSVFF
jgi:hypothetical protein